MNGVIFRSILAKAALLIITLGAGILRIGALERYPPALFLDEVSQGYNAYSILRTGRDEYGIFLPVGLRAFGEWKPPLQTYLMIPAIFIFGLNERSVRIGSALLGTLTVPLVYLLVLELLNTQAYRQTISITAYASAVLLAISPWHIVQSRAALHGSVLVFLLVLGAWAAIAAIRSRWMGIVAAASFSLMLYTYFGMIVTVLLFSVVILVWQRKHLSLKTHLRPALAALIITAIMITPLAWASLKQPEIIFGRAKYISIFHDRGVPLTVWQMITDDGAEIPSLLARFFHNKPYQYLLEFQRRFLQHLDLRFLFLTGPDTPPFKIPNVGLLYLIDGVMLFAGAVFTVKKNPRLFWFLTSWIFISIIPAALTFMTPSANRIFPMVIPVVIFTALGIAAFIDRWKWTLSLIIVLYALNFGYALYQFCAVLPYDHAEWWNGGYRELIEYTASREHAYSAITISGQAAGPYIYLLFYTQTDPALVQSNIIRDLTKDEFGFEHVTAYGKYRFPRNFTWEKHKDQLVPGSLLAVTGKETVGPPAEEIHRILYPNGKTAFTLYRIP